MGVCFTSCIIHPKVPQPTALASDPHVCDYHRFVSACVVDNRSIWMTNDLLVRDRQRSVSALEGSIQVEGTKPSPYH